MLDPNVLFRLSTHNALLNAVDLLFHYPVRGEESSKKQFCLSCEAYFVTYLFCDLK